MLVIFVCRADKGSFWHQKNRTLHAYPHRMMDFPKKCY
ncbi:hypothetical protein FAEPRAM212_01444 [Faecalibacterium prausnitzii M21/2]|uniref:Uncharacterized protein n=1 Tax=Faecalibacterium prausnitzii M21/2 TaxID=411485 RepID=A8SAR1_9FIRM|nr:hypothetical protein FAEPRAM212_01444 [Faecalibacterium prausnitzii M21/2]